MPICTAVSASTTSTASVRRREASAWVRATPRLATTCFMAASCSWEAPAASLAPLAICSMARRSSSAAAAASVRPLASSSVAAARRSETLSCGRADTRPAAPFCWPLRAGGRVDGRAGARIGGSPGGAAVPAVSLDFLTRAIGFPGTMRIARDGTQSHAYRPLDVATLVEFAALSKAGVRLATARLWTPWTPRLRRHRASGPCFSRLLACASSSLA